MLTIPASVRVFLALGATDMRKSFDTLARVARDVIGEDPLSGHFFVYCNRRRNRLKLLHWNGNGFWLYAKRLEKGQFTWPGRMSNGETSLEMSGRELAAVLGGIDLRQATRKDWYQRPQLDGEVDRRQKFGIEA